jgi:hypothetical protein
MDVTESGSVVYNKLQILSDLGSTVLYGGTTETKDLSYNNHKKSRSDVVIFTGVLDLKLNDFTAVRQGQNVFLQWHTSLENNIAYFEVQRAADIQSFSSLTRMLATGRDYNAYSQIDYSPLKGKNFYRLKIVDINGKVQYSRIVQVNFNDASIVSVYPNPVTNGSFTVTVNTPGIKEAAVYNNYGVLINKFQFTGTKKEITTSLMARGTYYIVVSENNSVLKNEKLVILK